MNARDYIQRVYEQISSADSRDHSGVPGAFLGAALAIIGELESPVKEEALVSLALLEVSKKRASITTSKRAA